MHMEDAGASGENQYIVLSREISLRGSEHLFAVSKPVPARR